MFAKWWSRKQDKPFPDIAVPDLDREVSAHWGRGIAPAAVPPMPATDSSPSESLQFSFTESYRTREIKERKRHRRRLVLSLLVGLVMGPVVVVGMYYLFMHVNSAVRGTQTLGQRMTFGGEDQEEIFYTDDISSNQAWQLGAFLQAEGIFDGLRPKSVRVAKAGEVFVVGFAMAWNNWQEQKVADDFRDLLSRLSRSVFDGSPVEIHLCARQPDSQGQPMPTMRVIRANDNP